MPRNRSTFEPLRVEKHGDMHEASKNENAASSLTRVPKNLPVRNSTVRGACSVSLKTRARGPVVQLLAWLLVT